MSQTGCSMIVRIVHDDKILGIIIPRDFSQSGIQFFTPETFSQQLAYMKRPKYYRIEPHVHNPIPREVHYTQEVLILKKGKLRVDFYDDKQKYIESHVIRAGDVILLATGGHGFEALEEVEIIEVKQGPYTGDEDKTRFDGISNDQIMISKTENESNDSSE